MQRKLSIITLLILFSVPLSFADTFTDAIQDLAVVAACKVQYSMAEVGGGWNEDPHDYYTPQMMAKRFAQESGNMTRTTTFYGVCFDYAQIAWEYVTTYKDWYNKQGMYEEQFWIAGVDNNPNQIEIMGIGTKSDYTRLQNGVPIKIYPPSLRNVKTHNGATNHAWVWIERCDGVWFWIDPTWTDNSGYVVYGYVTNGKEVQCRPDSKYCINYPPDLNDLPLPPAMGTRMSPSKTANSNDRNETIKDAGTQWSLIDELIENTFINVNYTGMRDYEGLLAYVNVPFSGIKDKNININKMAFGLEMHFLTDSIALFCGLEYLHNLEDGNNLHGGLLTFGFDRRLLDWLSVFIGSGLGVRFDTKKEYFVPSSDMILNTGYFAFKANTGVLLNLAFLMLKIEVSLDSVLGFSAGTGLGICWEMF